MEDNILTHISEELGEIKGAVKGINRRLDITNGNIGKNQDKINQLETFRDNLTGKIVILVAIVGMIVSFVGSFAKDLISNYLGV